jgi:hypothetical protein
MSDIVGDIITRLAIECPELTVDAIYRVESAIRREYGGDKVCIHAVDRELRRESALRAVNAGFPVGLVSDAIGVSRMSVYRFIKK